VKIVVLPPPGAARPPPQPAPLLQYHGLVQHHLAVLILLPGGNPLPLLDPLVSLQYLQEQLVSRYHRAGLQYMAGGDPTLNAEVTLKFIKKACTEKEWKSQGETMRYP